MKKRTSQAFTNSRSPKRVCLFLSLLFIFFNNADTNGQTNPQLISTIAGKSSYTGYTGDGGPATAAEINVNAGAPLGIVVDKSENVYFTDYGNNCIRKIDIYGVITTIAGNGTSGFSGDGGPATAAEMHYPEALTMDISGNLYIHDMLNLRIRKVDHSGMISTFAGTGSPVYSGDGGPATAAGGNFGEGGIAADGSGNIYIALGGTYACVREINSSGIINLVAGDPGITGYSGDGGPAIAAKFGQIEGLAIDGSGNVYIGDYQNYRVRMINSSGIISVFAGNGTTVSSGDGGAATAAGIGAYAVHALATDAHQNVYMEESLDNYIRQVNSAGIISTIAGLGGWMGGYSGDGGPATAAQVSTPFGITTDRLGDIYIIDNTNYVIREIFRNRDPYFTGGSRQYLTACKSGGAFSINTLLAVTDSDVRQTETWSMVAAPSHGTLAAVATAPAIGNVVTPAGLSYTPAGGYAGMDSFIMQVSDGYDSTQDTIVVNVISLPNPGVIAGAPGICVGDSALLSDAVAGGTWSYTGLIAKVTSATGFVTGLSLGTAIISYNVTNMCGTSAATYTVTMSGVVPAVAPITGSTNEFCQGKSIALSEPVTGGAWSSIGNATVSGTGVVTGTAGGTATITYSIVNGCGSASATYAVTIDPLPATGRILGLDYECPGTTITLSENVPDGTWSVTNPYISTISPAGIVTGVTPGVDTIIYTTMNACGTSILKYPFTVLQGSECTSGVNGLQPARIAPHIELSPNPCSGVVTFKFISGKDEYVSAIITNVMGEKVKEFTARANKGIDVRIDVPAGIYLLNVVTTSGRYVSKIVKE